MTERLSATKLCLAIFLAFGGFYVGVRVSNQKYYTQAKSICQRIDFSQLSESEKKEAKAMFGSFRPWSFSKEQKAYLKIPLEEKRKRIYEDFAPGNLDYYESIGVIDKKNLSDLECLNLVSMRDKVNIVNIINQ